MTCTNDFSSFQHYGPIPSVSASPLADFDWCQHDIFLLLLLHLWCICWRTGVCAGRAIIVPAYMDACQHISRIDLTMANASVHNEVVAVCIMDDNLRSWGTSSWYALSIFEAGHRLHPASAKYVRNSYAHLIEMVQILGEENVRNHANSYSLVWGSVACKLA